MKKIYFTFLCFCISLIGFSQNQAFITTWELIPDNKTITIPTMGSGYDYTIDFGDGTVLTNQTGDVEHTYATVGTYTISISGDFPRIFFNEASPASYQLKSIDQWGDIQWSSMNHAFNRCYQLSLNASDVPDLSQVEDLSFMFGYVEGSFNESISDWDVSNVTNMSNLFAHAEEMNQPLNSWDVSNVTDMSGMFLAASSFDQALDNWDVANVTTMSGMFSDASSFNHNIENWDVSNVTNMSGMFTAAISFNQALNNWDVSNVTNTSDMFGLATSFNQPLHNWNVAQVTDMSGMFVAAMQFNQPLNTWDVGEVTTMFGMFAQAQLFNQPLSNWDVSKVEAMNAMFLGASSFNRKLNDWDVSSLINMKSIFNGATAFNQPLSTWDVSSVELMSSAFSGATSYDQPLNTWNVSNVVEMSQMFNQASAFNQTLENWDVSNVMDMSGMFSSASAFNQDFSTWDFNPAVSFQVGNTISTPFIANSGLDVDNYDLLLERFETLGLQNKNLGANNLEYCNIESRTELINNLGWTIEGDALAEECNFNLNNSVLEKSISLYPNPVNNILHIQTKNGIELEEIVVYNVQGRQLLVAKENLENLSLSHFSSGIYLIKLKTNQGEMNQQLVKK